MSDKYKVPRYKILNRKDIDRISSVSFQILENIGFRIPNIDVRNRLNEFGAITDHNSPIVKFPEKVILKAIDSAGKKHILYGRDKNNKAEFGYNKFNFNGSGGQYQLIDQKSLKRFDPTMSDLRKAIKIGDALENINVVGALVTPSDVHPKMKDIYAFYELLNGTTKPFTSWVYNGKSAKVIIELMKVVSSSSSNLKKYPPYETFVEPISPLSFAPDSLDIITEFANNDLPIGFSPMVQAGSTGPIFLAGTLAQENAEVLAGIIITQAFKPGLPVTYGGIPHVMDMKAGMISFGSPEQGLMAAAVTQLAKSYGFPVYNNTGMTDSKIPDAQSGIEKAGSILLGALAGGDIFGHLGISGADNGANITQLIIDDEMAGYVRRLMRSFTVNDETLSYKTIQEVGIGGNFLKHEQTLANFRKDIWYPTILDRRVWDSWANDGEKNIIDRAFEKEKSILEKHEQKFLDEDINKECLKIIKSFKETIL